MDTDQDTDQDTLNSLLAAVQAATPAVRLAAARVEQSSRVDDGTLDKDGHRGGELPSDVDLAVVNQWLDDLGQVATLVCDQLHPVSKELGAQLEAITSDLRAHLNRS